MANTSETRGPLTPTGTLIGPDLDFDRVLSRLVRGITGLPDGMVRPRWQEVPPDEPAKDADWCAVGVTDETPFDSPSVRHISDGEGYSVLRSTTQLEILASFYGPHSRGLARLFADAFWIGQNREYLTLNSLSYVRTGVIRSVPALVNTTNRWRTDVPLTLLQVVERRYEIRNVLQGVGTIHAKDQDPSGIRLPDVPFASPLPRP